MIQGGRAIGLFVRISDKHTLKRSLHNCLARVTAYDAWTDIYTVVTLFGTFALYYSEFKELVDPTIGTLYGEPVLLQYGACDKVTDMVIYSEALDEELSLDLAAEEAIRCLTSQEGASYSCATIDKAVRAMSQEEQKELSRNILQFFMLAGLY